LPEDCAALFRSAEGKRTVFSGRPRKGVGRDKNNALPGHLFLLKKDCKHDRSFDSILNSHSYSVIFLGGIPVYPELSRVVCR
jgi:hypothetical protein